jgi:hypothetical protein
MIRSASLEALQSPGKATVERIDPSVNKRRLPENDKDTN